MNNAEKNRQVFDRVADSYVDLALMPAERAVMARLAGHLREFDMLDIGVGAGRTGYTFAPLVRRYVGLDYSPRMIERAQNLLGEDERVELVSGDARDLSIVKGPFDFVLFSFNGIDAVGHEDRLKILSEVHRVLKPDGNFLFSSHSMGTLPLSTKKHRSAHYNYGGLRGVYAYLADIRYGRRVRKINRLLDLQAARERGWLVVPKMGHNFAIDDYYVDPEYQVEQLREAGFGLTAIYDVAGRIVQPPYRGRDPWLDYFCHPARP